MTEQLISEIPITSAVDLEQPADQNREEMQWENLRTEIKPIEEDKIFRDTGTYMLHLALSSVKKLFKNRGFWF
jgi:hypothetical protein